MGEYLLLERTTPGTIGYGLNVIFDTATVISTNITYDNVSGMITINAAGVYEINWNLAIQSSHSGSGLDFAIVPSAGAIIKSSNPVKTGEVSGIAFVEVQEPPVTVTLINLGEEAPFSSFTESKGILTVKQIADLSASESATAGSIIPFSSGGLLLLPPWRPV